jgi:hypothetical protein
VAAVLLHRSVSRLVEHPPQIFIAFRRATAVVLFGTFVLAGTGPHPRSEIASRGKRAGLHSHFGDHLLRRIHSETRHFRQSDQRVLMGLHGLRDQTVELGDLPINQL